MFVGTVDGGLRISVDITFSYDVIFVFLARVAFP